MPTGMISKTFTWLAHPGFADNEPIDWFAFFILVIMIGLLWSRVVKQVVENV